MRTKYWKIIGAPENNSDFYHVPSSPTGLDGCGSTGTHVEFVREGWGFLLGPESGSGNEALWIFEALGPGIIFGVLPLSNSHQKAFIIFRPRIPSYAATLPFSAARIAWKIYESRRSRNKDSTFFSFSTEFCCVWYRVGTDREDKPPNLKVALLIIILVLILPMIDFFTWPPSGLLGWCSWVEPLGWRRSETLTGMTAKM